MKKILFLLVAVILSPPAKAQEYVDLGLSVNWATHNIDATTPEEEGSAFVAGTVQKYYPGISARDVTIYDHNIDYSGNPNYDAATQLWGDMWRTPTYNEWNELITRCVWTWCSFVSTNGIKVKGYEITGPNGNKIFLPCRTDYKGKYLKGGGYMCSTPVSESRKMSVFFFTNKKRHMCEHQYFGYTLFGFPIRAVSDKE